MRSGEIKNRPLSVVTPDWNQQDHFMRRWEFFQEEQDFALKKSEQVYVANEASLLNGQLRGMKFHIVYFDNVGYLDGGVYGPAVHYALAAADTVVATYSPDPDPTLEYLAKVEAWVKHRRRDIAFAAARRLKEAEEEEMLIFMRGKIAQNERDEN